MSGKIHPKKPVTYVPGPTLDTNSPAKFPNKGKEHGKTKSTKTVMSNATGPVYTSGDNSLVPDMHPSEYGVGKSMGQHAEKGFNPHSRKPTAVSENPVVTTPPYPLKKSYEK
jgi:hypothetical protein